METEELGVDRKALEGSGDFSPTPGLQCQGASQGTAVRNVPIFEQFIHHTLIFYGLSIVSEVYL